MTSETVCQFNKYGHCKFSEKCRRLHIKETCENKTCEIFNCSKRHPKKCLFFEQYNRCKFGEFCSYSHTFEKVAAQPDNTIEDMKARLQAIEKDMREKDEEIKVLKKTFADALENISKAVIEKTTESLVKVITDNQDAMEKRNESHLNTLHEQLKILSDLLLPSVDIPAAHAHKHQPKAPLNQCDDCGKTFGSNRALLNHARNEHNKPES